MYIKKSTYSIPGWELIYSTSLQGVYLTNGDKVMKVVGIDKNFSTKYVLKNYGFFYFPNNCFSTKNYKNEK